jgi:radical SAM superfamily enzyme YgiQ (UPF0313 family)
MQSDIREEQPMTRRIKFLLINPAAPQWRVPPGTSPPLATRIFRFSMLSSLYVAAAMPRSVETRLLDEEVEPVDFDSDADLVGISSMTFNAPRAYEIADRFRLEKRKTVILGGYHPTFVPHEALAHADAVCMGEAEPNMPYLVEDYLSGRLKRTYSRGPADLGSLRPLNRGLLRHDRYAWADAMQATRGCRHQCTFCSITSFFDHKFRARPIEDVTDELRQLGKRILFMDDNLITQRDYASQLFSRMIPLKRRWYSQCGIAIADDEALLALAVRSGCGGLFIGLESLSQNNLRAWRKSHSRARDYRRAIARLHDAGIAVYAGIVFGYDWDTPEVFAATLEFLLDSRVDALQATILTPFPGTPLFQSMEREGRIVDRDWSHYDFRHVVFEPRGMSPHALQAGHDWVLSNFYSSPQVISRILHQIRYLPLSTILIASAPLNYGYRRRLKTDGTWRSETPTQGTAIHTAPAIEGAKG